MNRIAIGLLVAATAGAVGWLAHRQPRQPAPPALAVSDTPQDKLVRQPPNVDPKMIRQPPNVDPKMIRQPPWPKVPAQEPTGPRKT